MFAALALRPGHDPGEAVTTAGIARRNEAASARAEEERRTLLLLFYADAAASADLVRSLSASGRYDIVTCPLSQPAGALVDELRPQLVLLQPPEEKSGQMEACETVRAATDRPIVVLSHRHDELRVTRTLMAGIDEYLALPIGERELAARIDALARRLGARVPSLRTAYGDIALAIDDQSVDVGGRRADLSPIEFRLLSCLVAAQGKVVTHDALMSRVWGAEYVDSRHYLHLYIRYLREKLEPDPNDAQLILSEWGIGYRLCQPNAPALASRHS